MTLPWRLGTASHTMRGVHLFRCVRVVCGRFELRSGKGLSQSLTVCRSELLLVQSLTVVLGSLAACGRELAGVSCLFGHELGQGNN